MNVRLGTPTDIPQLESIAMAAKAFWGYSPEQLEAWRAELSVPASSMLSRPVYVAELPTGLVGFVQLAKDTTPWEIWALWVHPSHIGSGIGSLLLGRAQREALAGGQTELAIDADPNAVSFYIAKGARQVGEVPAPIAGEPDRVRPQLRLGASAA